MAVVEPPEKSPVGSVFLQWKQMPKLVLAAAGGTICKIGTADDLDRKEVCQNEEVLTPVIKYLGFLASYATGLFCLSSFVDPVDPKNIIWLHQCWFMVL